MPNPVPSVQDDSTYDPAPPPAVPGGSGAGGAALADAHGDAQARLRAAFALWRGRLIDLTKRNRALNYRPAKVSTLTIVDEKPAEIYRLLIGEEQALTFSATLPSKTQEPARPAGPLFEQGSEDQHGSVAASQDDGTGGDEEDEPAVGTTAHQPFVPYDREELRAHHRDTVLQCRTTPEGLDVSLRRLAELQRTSIEEQGVNTLYLALGFLHYREAAQAQTFIRAPLVLVPVVLERTSARAEYRLLLGEDEPVLNPSLVEYLRRVHLVQTFPALPEPGDDPTSVDIQPLLNAIAEDIAAPRGWHVTEEIAVAAFAFQKLVIFKDLETNEGRFGRHPLVRRVVLKQGEPEHDLPPEIKALDLDRDYPPEATAQVLDADSSQVRAIAAVAKGHHLVIHGPPGTGKSQTITNLIADALGAGKRVLFVSEKMAALEVVRRRLAEAKLGEFCLELHSTKVGKAGVLEDLRHTLNATAAPAAGVTTSAAALAKARGHLNAYAADLHTPRTTLACSAFHAIGEFARSFDAPRLRYPGDATALRPEQLVELTEKLRRAETLGREVAPVSQCGWRTSRLDTITEDRLSEIRAVVEAALDLVTAFLTGAADLAQRFGVPAPTTTDQVVPVTAAADHLTRSPGVPEPLLRDIAWAPPPESAMALIAVGRRFAALDQRLAGRYRREDLDTVDLDDVRYVEERLSGTFSALFALLDGRYRAIRRRWQAMRAAESVDLPMLEQAADLKQLPRWREDRQALVQHPNGAVWFGAAWRGPTSDWSDLEARLAWVAEFHRLVATVGPFGDAAYALGTSPGRGDVAPGALRDTAEQLRTAIAALRQAIRWPEDLADAQAVTEIGARIDELRRDLDRGPAWVAFVRAINALGGTTAEPMAEAAFCGTIPVDALSRTFRRSLYGAWLDAVVPTVPTLADFAAASHEDTRRTFQQLDAGLLKEHQHRLVSRLREMGQNRYAQSTASHRAFLSREFAKQRRHRPLRVTLREAASAVAALKPCFLMSPLSVSQFLAPDAEFDLVVFDEASQLPTEDAIAAVCRGTQCVVVGDPKQLPPTAFFAIQIGAVHTTVDEDGELVLEETESVLEEFQGAGLHQAYLEWHYRSAHESLIQFSNERFYGSRLVVFPAAATDSPEFGVQFEYLPGGRYEGAGLNSVKARRVAEAVVEHFRTRPHETLGVGTFNQRQQMAILDELERFRREDPSLEDFFSRGVQEPFFVKNLENIQGDERDVIFLSITYAKRADGRLHYNFGPLNKEQGWRRLNVLVSRARRRMRVFSSLKAADINPAAVATQGPALLRDFLDFAETGKLQVTSNAAAAEADSPFELEVGEELERLGFLIDRQVGVGPYRIDIGVRDPQRPGRYLAGVECDGAAYHAAPWARDRDRLRQQVLEGRGWAVIRVWSTDWFRARAATIERLRRTLDTLRAQMAEEDQRQATTAPAAPEPRTPIALPSEPPVSDSGAPGTQRRRAYVRPLLPRYALATPLAPVTGSLLDATSHEVARQVVHIVQMESPVHWDDVVLRLLYAWQQQRRGARLVAAAEAGMELAIRRQSVLRRGDFLYSGEPVRPRNRSGMNLTAEHVAPEELKAAARAALVAADALSEADLAAEAREMLGLRRTNDGAPRIHEAIQSLVQDGEIVYAAAGLRLRHASG